MSISANRQTNSVIVTAPADAMELIEKIIGELDQSGEGTVGIVRMYPLKHAEVRATVTMLKELFAPARSTRGSRAPAAAALENDQATELSSRRDLAEAEAEVRNLQLQATVGQRQRAELAAAVDAWQKKIDSARDRLDADGRADFELRLGLAQARSQLDSLMRKVV